MELLDGPADVLCVIAVCSREEQGVHMAGCQTPWSSSASTELWARLLCNTPSGNAILCILCARWSGQCGMARGTLDRDFGCLLPVTRWDIEHTSSCKWRGWPSLLLHLATSEFIRNRLTCGHFIPEQHWRNNIFLFNFSVVKTTISGSACFLVKQRLLKLCQCKRGHK